jgi:hypothetical protein
MKKLPRALRFARRPLVVALSLVLLVFVASFFVDEPLRRSIERRMNDRLEGYDVLLPKLRVRVFSLSIALDGLTVRQKAHPEPPVLRIERLTTSVHWRALLSGRLVADVLLERPRVDLDLVQLRQEVKDGVPVNERGWQEALQEVTPLKIDLFRVEDGTVTYVDADPAHPIRMTSLRIRANDIRNVQSKPQVYPSPIHAEATLFGSGRGVLDGHADFLAEPYPGFHLAEIDRGPSPGLVPLRERRELPVRRERQRQVSPRYVDGAVELFQTLRVEVGSGPGVAKGGDEGLLAGVVLRKRPAHGADTDGRSRWRFHLHWGDVSTSGAQDGARSMGSRRTVLRDHDHVISLDLAASRHDHRRSALFLPGDHEHE